MNWEEFTQRKEILITGEDTNKINMVSVPLTEEIELKTHFWELLMEYTLHNENCLGMCGMQIGLPYRGFYLAINALGEFRFRNPEIIRQSARNLVFRSEGCMSYPGEFIDTLRPAWVWIKDDINGEKEYSGLLGTCIMHEMGHLQGTTMFDHKAPEGYKAANVGRNDKCPYCIEQGNPKPPKYKKCKQHFV